MAKPAAMAPIATFLALVGVLALLLSAAGPAGAQQVGACPCPPDECCSQWGFCGTTEDYCGQGCTAGPCWPQAAARAMASGAKAVGNNNHGR